MGEKQRFTCHKRLAVFDFEVTAYDWLLVIKDRQTGEYYCFHNDYQGVEDFIKKNDFIYVAYNNKHYDNYILKGVLNHYEPEQIKEINDWIIVEKRNGWEYPYDNCFISIPPTCDLMLDMPLRQSLKELEGNMCMHIQESSVDFNIDHPWTQKEFDEMLCYCKRDVDATERLIDERAGYLESKLSLGELCGLSIEESLYRTNAQLSAKSLGAKKVERNDYHDYVIPSEVEQSLIPTEILEFVDVFKMTEKNELQEDNFKLKWKGNIAGVPHIIGLGGIHGAIENYQEKSDENRIILNFDVTSYYPSLLIQYSYLSRNVIDSQIYTDYYHERIDAKRIGDKKKTNGLKLVLNTTYGASLQKFNELYDPLMGVSTCLTGQLLLVQLIKMLEINITTFQLIQSNTDGIMFSINKEELENTRHVVDTWSKQTRLTMEEKQINKVVQKDVNNYIIETSNKKLEFKGAYVSDYPNGSFKHNSMSIVAEAVIKNLIYGESIEDIIYSCNDPFRFQLIAKTGSSYDYTVHYVDDKEIKVQKVNRLYAVKEKKYGVVKKVKRTNLIVDEDGERRYYINLKGKRTYKKNWETDDKGDFFIKKDTTQNCPDHAYIDNSCQITIDTIDKEWYINIAKKRINDFLGIKEEKKMSTKKKVEETVTLPSPIMVDENGNVTVNEVLAKIQLYKKIKALQTWLRKQPLVTDGYNSLQKYEYVRASRYRELLGDGCEEVGLLFDISIVNSRLQKLEETKNMNLTTIQGVVTFIDPDTGCHKDSPFIADGTDSLDKAIYKAETMAIKYFVQNKFLLRQQQDDIDPENEAYEKQVKKSTNTEIKTKTSIPVTPKQREEAKVEIVSDNNASPMYIQKMIEAINKIQEAGGVDKKGKPYGQSTKENLEKVLKGELTLDKKEAVSKMTKIEEKMDEIGVE